MLAYQHAYHAGNFADVHKHLALYSLCTELLRKNSSVTYIDTHAGRGVYPLDTTEAQKRGEYREGILPLWKKRKTLANDALLNEWLIALARLQKPGDQMSHYPGSPWWLEQQLRRQDKLHLYELHPGEHRHLTQAPLTGNIKRYQADGLKGFKTHVPVSTPRLCALIDPSYEIKSDYEAVAETLGYVARKVRHAVIVVWYPLLPEARHQALLEGIRTAGLRKVWRSELLHHAPEGERGMYGSGLLLLNPPWQLPERLSASLTRVAECYGKHASHHQDWWSPE
ncbi:23S rRNA (adenine(2030)-N(6))-methyltransferase RlmJ [Phytohalomonas tamaricis]|uniref:23S rRNA (adenine(2030)-N(6))-methyltransferase RlmJ n=1 Tax=Phytohalomonas tamaricis TaxID=2081032 RepID=UPI000D0B3534|nr:23S rRNA (adenine(2030)-N(6))-methyltransferase RlmJ [Phytohalomonas tamaricis]